MEAVKDNGLERGEFHDCTWRPSLPPKRRTENLPSGNSSLGALRRLWEVYRSGGDIFLSGIDRQVR